MTSIPISQAREHLADFANRVSVRGDRIVVERRGKSVFALVPVEDLELLEQLEDRIDLEAVRQRMNEPTESLAKVKKELGL